MKTTDKDYKFMEDTLLKNPHDVNLTWQVDYANLAAISITPIGNIYVTVNDDGVVLLELPWSARKHTLPEFTKGLLPTETTAQMMVLMRCAEIEYSSHSRRSTARPLFWHSLGCDDSLEMYVARTPFGDIRVEYGLNAETFTTIETPWGSGAEALYLGDYKREVTLSPRQTYPDVGTRVLTPGKKSPAVSFSTVLVRLEDIYASIINAEFAAIGAQNPALYSLEACLTSELTAEYVAERFASSATNIQEEL
jgi:hypothetical protein